MTAHASPELDLPPAIRAMIAGYAWDRDTLGHSDAGVFRLEATDRPRLFLKVEESGGHAELPAEVERLRWLAGQGVACPEVLAFGWPAVRRKGHRRDGRGAA